MFFWQGLFCAVLVFLLVFFEGHFKAEIAKKEAAAALDKNPKTPKPQNPKTPKPLRIEYEKGSKEYRSGS